MTAPPSHQLDDRGNTHAAADGNIITDYLTFLYDRNKPKIMGKNINIIRWGNSKNYLEFTRQIKFTVNRLFIPFFLTDYLFIIYPYFMICAGARQKII